ncbi:MAG: Mur ligase domain-containing protein, partial [Nitriliruptoraceae bacterium]
MIELTLSQVAATVGARLPGRAGAALIDAVATDSRAVPAGRPLFIALRTAQGDGHAHAADAVAAGAVAVLAEREVAVEVPVLEVADTWAALRALATEVR